MKKDNRKYNVRDFARYHSGKMPADEMHVLEKAALLDPFLADALEGYVYSKDPERELHEIEIKLSERKNDQKVFRLPTIAWSAWWKVASILILIAGGAYLFLIDGTITEKPLASKQENTAEETQSLASQLNNDTLSAKDNIALNKIPSHKIQSHPKVPTIHAKAAGVAPREKTPELKTNKIQDDKLLSEKPIVTANENVVAFNEERIQSSDRKIKDSKGETVLMSADTNKANYISKRKIQDTGQFFMNAEEISEVVATGYRNKRGAEKKLEGRVSGIGSATLPIPYGGREKFEQYVRDSAATILDSDGVQLEADILLSFALDKKGKPSKITVLHSNCEACEKEAIRLLKSGPKWIGKPGVTATVRLKF